MRVVWLILAATGLLGGIMQAQVAVLPYQSTLTLPEGSYGVQMCDGKCTGMQAVKTKEGKVVAALMKADGSMSCPSPNGPGMIHVSSSSSLVVQRKVLIHEVVHAAIACDKREVSIEERIAEDVSALYDDQNFHNFMTGGH